MALQKLFIVAICPAVVFNLGAGRCYMVVAKRCCKRTVNSLTWRIGLSVGLIALVVLGISTGTIQPHGIQVGH